MNDGPAGRALAPAWLVHDLCVGPRSRRPRVSHACHVRMPRPRSPLTHMTARGSVCVVCASPDACPVRVRPP
eukprot:7009920-Prymnesium_polylepis.1